MAITPYMENGKKLFEIHINGFDVRGRRVQRRKRGVDAQRKVEVAEFEMKRELAKLKDGAVRIAGTSGSKRPPVRCSSPWELAPAYDVTFAHNPDGEWTHQHLMSVNGKFSNFTIADFLEIADRFGIGSARGILGEVRGAIKSWPKFANKAGISIDEATRIGDLLITFEE